MLSLCNCPYGLLCSPGRGCRLHFDTKVCGNEVQVEKYWTQCSMFVNNDIYTLLGKYFLMSTSLLKVPHYHFINSSLTWYEAQYFCRIKYTDLATMNSMNDKNKLVNTLGSHVTHSWIGLYREGTRRWMWSDGRGRADFTMWTDGEPSNSEGKEWCGELSEEGWWNDVECEKERSFVCYERE
uniref:C-type lectin domain-containing protein n=1 Tax=Dicentrarchus labrax TaxID=13489 RepID=A0A8C4DME0_DICLA